MDDPTAYVCVIEARFHVADSQGLKSKRKVIRSLKDAVRHRYGASVSEVGGHDSWQRSTLLISLTGGAEVAERAAEVERFIAARCPDGSSFERTLRSLEDLRA
jgi:uncharacterized protein YlxP (DUF503 family)